MEKKNQNIRVVTVVLVIFVARLLWQSPVEKDLKALLNENNTVLSTNHAAINAEIQNWQTYTQLSQYQNGINNIIIPKIDASMEVLNNTEIKTVEVLALKQQYINGLTLFRKSIETIIEAINMNDDAKLDQALSYLEQAETELKSFNTNLRTLAEKHDMYIVNQ